MFINGKPSINNYNYKVIKVNVEKHYFLTYFIKKFLLPVFAFSRFETLVIIIRPYDERQITKQENEKNLFQNQFYRHRRHQKSTTTDV